MATRLIFSGNTVLCSVPWRVGTGRVGTDSTESVQARCTLSDVLRPDKSLKAVSDLNERDGQCANTLRGLDSTHPAASSS